LSASFISSSSWVGVQSKSAGRRDFPHNFILIGARLGQCAYKWLVSSLVSLHALHSGLVNVFYDLYGVSFDVCAEVKRTRKQDLLHSSLCSWTRQDLAKTLRASERQQILSMLSHENISEKVREFCIGIFLYWYLVCIYLVFW
jgi:hypothetical protein